MCAEYAPNYPSIYIIPARARVCVCSLVGGYFWIFSSAAFSFPASEIDWNNVRRLQRAYACIHAYFEKKNTCGRLKIIDRRRRVSECAWDVRQMRTYPRTVYLYRSSVPRATAIGERASCDDCTKYRPTVQTDKRIHHSCLQHEHQMTVQPSLDVGTTQITRRKLLTRTRFIRIDWRASWQWNV